jgi:hypothetical protein
VKPKRYIVSRGPADRWEIGFDLIGVGSFSSEAAAIQSAIKAASGAGKEHSAGSEVGSGCRCPTLQRQMTVAGGLCRGLGRVRVVRK